MKFYCIRHKLPKLLANAHHIIRYTGAINCVPCALCTRLLATNLYMLEMWRQRNRQSTYCGHIYA